jgi:hypothetical protein
MLHYIGERKFLQVMDAKVMDVKVMDVKVLTPRRYGARSTLVAALLSRTPAETTLHVVSAQVISEGRPYLEWQISSLGRQCIRTEL